LPLRRSNAAQVFLYPHKAVNRVSDDRPIARACVTNRAFAANLPRAAIALPAVNPPQESPNMTKRIMLALSAATLALSLAAAPAAFAQDKMSKDSMSKDTMSKDKMSKDTMSKDKMHKDGMAKDTMSKDGMKK
jgi:pentapeptide MXKDX repeat protein